MTFDLEPHGDQVKLTVIHDDFPADSLVREIVSGVAAQALGPQVGARSRLTLRISAHPSEVTRMARRNRLEDQVKMRWAAAATAAVAEIAWGASRSTM